MVDIEQGVSRVTFDLPFGIDHVHCYFLRSSSGGWILVDTGLGSRDPEARWRPVLEQLEAGDVIDGWRVEVLRGHADGHIVLLRDGVMIAGDVILGGITPAIGLYPNSRPDPLGDYFETLDRIEQLAPRVAYSGHKE